MEKRMQLFSRDGLLTSYTDVNNFEINLPEVQKQYSDLLMIVLSVRTGMGKWEEIGTVYMK